MAWQSGALVLPIFTFCFFAWLCPYASFGQNVDCWWNRVIPDNHNVSIECRAKPQSFLQKCGRCRLHLLTTENTAQATLHQCSRNTAHFFALFTPQFMQSINCELSCPEQVPGSCTIKEGYPPPTCLILFDDAEKDIYCHWTRSHYPPNPITFTLHWEDARDSMYHEQREVGDGDSFVIRRTEYHEHNDMKVWVSARSTLGSVQSDSTVFSTANIREPRPPIITNHTYDPLEIFWNMEEEGDEGISQEWQCEVQYKNEYDLDWTEAVGTYDATFVLDDPEPFTKYMFRVRCWFSPVGLQNTVMSDWCSYTVEIPAAAPVGKLDVWSDCDANSEEPTCTVLWKEMPKIQARSQISNYLVRVKLNNGSELSRAEYTAADLCTQCVKVVDEEMNNVSQCLSCLSCHQKQDQCCFQYSQLRVPIREVKDICVTANSIEGESSPAHVALPTLGLLIPEVSLKVRGESHSLNVSWFSHQEFSKSIQEYVVQHKPVGLPHKPCLNWVKVDKTQNSVKLKGQFWNYTAYNISLFAVVNNCSYLLQSAVAYTVQGVPSKVMDLFVTDISSSSVNLTWSPIQSDKSRGIILKYLVGLGNDTEWNVNSSEHTFHLSKLNPGQQYEVWICAVTTAGEGERTTTTFTTQDNGYIVKVVIILLLFIVLIILIVFIVCYCSQSPFTEWLKIPDPLNSSLLKQKNNQFQQAWLLPNSPSENTQTISQVEVITLPDRSTDLEDEEYKVELAEVDQQQTQPEEAQEHEEDQGKELQESNRVERINSMPLQRTKEYRQVIDSSEGEANTDDEDEEWDGLASPSDYEKHFLPSVLDT